MACHVAKRSCLPEIDAIDHHYKVSLETLMRLYPHSEVNNSP